jgi:hypothetical protein
MGIGGGFLTLTGNGAPKGGALQKAYIVSIEPPPVRVDFPFNPKDLKLDRAITWSPRAQGGVDVPEKEYSRGEPRSFSVSTTVDEYERGGDVRTFVKQLETLCEPHSSNRGADKKPRPPYVQFGWGAMVLFPSVISKLSVHYTLFHPDGRPARASIEVSFDEVMKKRKGQNPTSAGKATLRMHMVLPGETIDQIAYAELGDAALWSTIAEENGIENPLALVPGQRLAIGG